MTQASLMPEGVPMSFVTDIRTDLRAVSESAIDQLADRFDDLPRPLLAAIGAGDLAMEQLAALRESLMEQFASSAPQPADVRSFTTDLPAKAQQAATEYAGKVTKAATEYAGKMQDTATD
jgi:hypothetical protein